MHPSIESWLSGLAGRAHVTYPRSFVYRKGRGQWSLVTVNHPNERPLPVSFSSPSHQLVLDEARGWTANRRRHLKSEREFWNRVVERSESASHEDESSESAKAAR